MQFTINVWIWHRCPRNLNRTDHRHRGLYPLLFTTSAVGSLSSPTRKTSLIAWGGENVGILNVINVTRSRVFFFFAAFIFSFATKVKGRVLTSAASCDDVEMLQKWNPSTPSWRRLTSSRKNCWRVQRTSAYEANTNKVFGFSDA